MILIPGSLALCATVVVILLLRTTAATHKLDGWNLVRAAIAEVPVTNFALSVGREERLFLEMKGNITMETTMNIASSSKMVGGMPMFKLLAEGKVKLHDPVNMYLPYWTKDPADMRSQLTIWHLLTFQSGYTVSMELDKFCPDKKNEVLEDCMEGFYKNVNMTEQPGTVWDYNSVHLQFIGAIYSEVMGKPTHQILKDFLVEWGMKDSVWLGDQNPMLAADLTTTGDDYEKFMIAYFNGKIIPSYWRYVGEGYYNPYPSVKDRNPWDYIIGDFVGGYGMLNWFECMVDVRSYPTMKDSCVKEDSHTDPGFFGYWPLYDRSHNYWMQIVYDGAPFTGCVEGGLLREVLKPLVSLAIDLHPFAKDTCAKDLPDVDLDALIGKAVTRMRRKLDDPQYKHTVEKLTRLLESKAI